MNQLIRNWVALKILKLIVRGFKSRYLEIIFIQENSEIAQCFSFQY